MHSEVYGGELLGGMIAAPPWPVQHFNHPVAVLIASTERTLIVFVAALSLQRQRSTSTP